MPLLCCRRIQFSVAFHSYSVMLSRIFDHYIINSDVTTKFELHFEGVVARPTNHCTAIDHEEREHIPVPYYNLFQSILAMRHTVKVIFSLDHAAPNCHRVASV